LLIISIVFLSMASAATYKAGVFEDKALIEINFGDVNNLEFRLPYDTRIFEINVEDYEIIDSRQASSTDLVVEVVISSNPSRFINSSSLEMKAQIKYIQTGPVVGFPWWIKFDQTIWKITY